MSKKLAIILLTLATVVMSVCFVGCGKGSQQEQFTLTVSAESIIMKVDDMEELTAKKDGADVVATWESSDTQVATVNATGTVTAVGVGTATITAKLGSKTATCAVEVLNATNYPQIIASNETLMVGGTVNLQPQLRFKGSNVSGTQFTYTSSDPTKAEVSAAGVVTAVGAGSAIITISANYMNVTVTKPVTITVEDDVVVALSDDALTLYLVPVEADQVSEDTVTATVTVNGQAVTNAEIEWDTDDDEVATVVDGVITAVGEGAATITATYVKDGVNYEESVIVTVNALDVEIEELIEEEIKDVWDISFLADAYADFFDDELTEITFTESGESFDFVQVDQTVAISTNGKDISGEHTVRFSNGKVNVTADVLLITKIIRTPDDFKSMLAYGGLTQEAFDAGQRYYEGYFVLAADLDFGGEENTWIKRLGYNYNGAENNGFKGVFDGRGHTIANVSLSEYDGLFGGVHRAATIKNVAFTGMTVSILGGIFGRECSGKLENVFIDVTFDGTDDTAVLGFYAYASAGLNNVVIALHGTLASENYAVLATGEFAGANITNCYIITNGLPIKEYSAFTVGETSVTATGLPTEYWDLSGDYPVFK